MKLKAYRFPAAWGLGVSVEWPRYVDSAIRACEPSSFEDSWPWCRRQVRVAFGWWCVVLLLWPEAEG